MVTTLSKVGNSMAVLLPKALRQQADIEANEPLRLASPRKGVVVITTVMEDGEDRLSRLTQAEARIAARAKSVQPWPEGTTADEFLKEGKGGRADEFLSL